MKPAIKKIVAGLLLFAFAVAAIQATGGVSDVSAASKSYMKKLKGPKWDLKKGKKVNVKTMYFGVGLKKESWELTDLEISDSKMKGYKELTATFVTKTEYKPSESDVDKITANLNDDGDISNGSRVVLVDYSTGLRVNKAKGFDVTVSYDWTTLEKNRYDGSHENYVNLYDNQCVVTVVYPEDYDGLCLGVTGSPLRKDNSNDQKFLDGKAAFGKTSYYKKAKTNSHWMRIRASKK